MGVRVKEKGDEQDGWEPFGWGSLKFVSFHWQHVIIPRPGAERNNCKRRSSDSVTDPGFQIAMSGPLPFRISPGFTSNFHSEKEGQPL
jgi:hypothetical protein